MYILSTNVFYKDFIKNELIPTGAQDGVEDLILLATQDIGRYTYE